MTSLPITITTTALLALVFAFLSARVVLTRFSSRTSLGDGGTAAIDSPLFCAIRGHANFAEYVPLSLLVLGGVELSHGPRLLVLALAAVLVVARVAHPVGIGMKAPNPLRAGGLILNLAMLIVGGVYLLVHQSPYP